MQAAHPTSRTAVAVAVLLLHAALGLLLVAAPAGSSDHVSPSQRPPVLWVQWAASMPEPPRPVTVASNAPEAVATALRQAPAPLAPITPSQPGPERTAVEQFPPAPAATPATAPADEAARGVDQGSQSRPSPAPDVKPDAGAGHPYAAGSTVAVTAVVRPPPPDGVLRRTAPDHGACPPARHPAALRDRGVEGEVHLRVLVGADGRAREVQVVAPSGWRLFDEAARVQALQCRFVPATEDGTPVDKWVTYPVVFALAAGAGGHQHASNLR